MSESISQMRLLYTRLHAPPVRDKWVVRTRLLQKLNALVNPKLTLICAPAGYGKTTRLNHRSIVAQEYGIPTVLGTGDATKRIHIFDACKSHVGILHVNDPWRAHCPEGVLSGDIFFPCVNDDLGQKFC